MDLEDVKEFLRPNKWKIIVATALAISTFFYLFIMLVQNVVLISLNTLLLIVLVASLVGFSLSLTGEVGIMFLILFIFFVILSDYLISCCLYTLFKKGKNWKVLAAIIAVLLVIPLLGMGGPSTSSTLGFQQAKNTCENACNSLINNIGYTTATSPGSGGLLTNDTTYCKFNYKVASLGDNIRCTNPGLNPTCSVTFQDGSSCLVTCVNGTAKCA